MTIEQLQRRIEENLGPGTRALAEGLEGTLDHVQAVVVSPKFEGLGMLEAHRMVLAVFQSEIASNELHAFTFKTYTPTEWEKRGGRP